MAKRGRPKKEVEEGFAPMMLEDTIFESQKYQFNHVGYQLHLDVKKRERLTKGIQQLHELAFGISLGDKPAKAMAIKLGERI